MNLITVLSQRETSTLSSPKRWLLDMFGGNITTSGVNVTSERAIQHTAVYDCVNILSQSIASLPLSVYKREVKKDKVHNSKAFDHTLYSILHDEPNSEMTSYSWRVVMMVHLALRGNHFSQIIRNNAGKVTGIYPLDPDKMQVIRTDSKEIRYMYQHDTYGQVPLYPYEVLHVLGMTMNGIIGMSPIEYNRHTIGMSIAMEEFGGTLFKNGATPSGVVSGEGVKSMSDTAFDRFKQSFKENYQGLMNAGKPLILEDGFKFTPITISNRDGQYLESRKFTKADIASMYRIPPHMINEMDKATFSNIEHQSIQFVTDAIRPWAVNIEQESRRKLLSDSEKNNHYVKFNLAALLRGDTTSRYTAYGMGIKDGWLVRNEAREMEDMNPIEGLDDPLYPLNMAKEGENAETK